MLGDGTAHLAWDAVVVAGYDDARRQAHDVPLEGCGVGLIEVVDVEGHRPLRRREHAEVGDVRIAAALHVDAARWCPSQVRSHDQGSRRGRSVNGETSMRPWRMGTRLRDPVRRLLEDHGDRIGTVCRGCPVALRGARDLVADGRTGGGRLLGRVALDRSPERARWVRVSAGSGRPVSTRAGAAELLRGRPLLFAADVPDMGTPLAIVSNGSKPLLWPFARGLEGVAGSIAMDPAWRDAPAAVGAIGHGAPGCATGSRAPRAIGAGTLVSGNGRTSR